MSFSLSVSRSLRWVWLRTVWKWGYCSLTTHLSEGTFFQPWRSSTASRPDRKRTACRLTGFRFVYRTQTHSIPIIAYSLAHLANLLTRIGGKKIFLCVCRSRISFLEPFSHLCSTLSNLPNQSEWTRVSNLTFTTYKTIKLIEALLDQSNKMSFFF